ncbi:TetR/AcrR family transcriptional regulator [Rhizobium halophytocola]|uniref:AcrR family transcriptional regulator n=1 Tax=Rhizobium halophytocola TaxID=735519 RepID=A0ABS4DX01_9HYPH|nr:TetR family transcriptional regulator [Rhizobium halophytocola]MBP1850224.1 AcrR family transcriptional regulator [Rhizobium halophytocola]
MKTDKNQPERRSDALSKARIVEAAIAILDSGGEGALTFRALAARLSTGPGAIYWHVANKNELLGAAADEIIGGVMANVERDAAPQAVIRAIALGVFDAIDRHPWVGTQFSRDPLHSASLQVFEGIGGRLQALGVSERVLFDAWSALVNYILGVAGQNAANARIQPPDTDRAAVLGAIAARCARLDPLEFPFVRQVAAQFRDHDDREQFLAGIDLILAGIATIR